MRGLKRNQQTLYYQLYSKHIPVYETDLDGNIIYDPVTGEPTLTGDYTVEYEKPVQFLASVSAARGEASTDPFGVNVEYDKTMCSCNMELPIDELSVLFVDKKPEYDENGSLTNKPDYKVVKVAGSLNSVLYAIKRMAEGATNG